MLLARIVFVLLSLGIGVSLIQWMLTGQSHYRARAWHLFYGALAAAFIILALFAIERIVDQ